MKKFAAFCLLLGLFTISHAQIITIEDNETGTPLELVTLLSPRTGAFATTNTEGKADISSFRDAEIIEIHRFGYRTKIKSYNDLKAASFILRMIPSPFNTEKVVVSATRWNQTADDIPAKIITLDPIDVELHNPQTAADLLNVTGNVFIQKSQQGGGSPMIRGFATNRLLYTVDGVRMNTAIFRSGNIQNVISLDPFAIEKTEVLFGPGSVIYGSDAIGGVMSFRTLKPQFSLSDDLLINASGVSRYAAANREKTGHFHINLGWKKWALISSISANDFEDLKMGSHGPAEYLRPFYVQHQDSTDVIITNNDPKVQRPSGYSQINMMQKLRFRPSQKWDMYYGFHYSETSDYARYDRQIRYKDGLPRYGEWRYGPQKWMMNQFKIEYNNPNRFFERINLRLAHQFFEESRISRNINSMERNIRNEKVDALSANIDFVKNFTLKHKFFYGLEIVGNAVVSKGTTENINSGIKFPGPGRYPQSTWGSYAFYLNDQYTFSEKSTLQTGLRYNHFTIDARFDTTFYPLPFSKATLNNGALTGSMGLVYRPQNDWVLSANLATAFRAPNVDDMGKIFDSEPGAVVVPNPGLKAEYAYNADLGLSRIFDDFVKIDFSAYYTLLDNALVRRDFALNGRDSILYDGELSRVQAVQNAGSGQVYGIQAGAELKLPRGFSITSEFNFQKGEEEMESGAVSPARHAPPWFGVSRLSYTATNLHMQFYAAYSGGKSFSEMPEEEKGKTHIYAQDEDGNPHSPRWYTINFKALYRFTDYLSVSAALENITDQRYRPYSSGIAAPGRNFILSIRAGL